MSPEAAYLKEAHNVPHIILESKVNHTIGLVHAQILACKEIETPLRQHIDELTGSCDDNMDVLVEDVRLLSHRDTTDAEEVIKFRVSSLCHNLAPFLDVLKCLSCKLSLEGDTVDEA